MPDVFFKAPLCHDLCKNAEAFPESTQESGKEVQSHTAKGASVAGGMLLTPAFLLNARRKAENLNQALIWTSKVQASLFPLGPYFPITCSMSLLTKICTDLKQSGKLRSAQ